MTAQAGPADEPTQQLLDHVQKNISEYNRLLPSLAADEAITSSIGAGPFHRTVHATAILRVLPADPTHPSPGHERLEEVRTFLTFQNQPVRNDGTPVPLPMTLLGGFGDLQSTYFSPAALRCFRYQAGSGPHGLVRIDFIADPNAVNAIPACNRAISVQGFALLQPGTAQLTHLERSVLQPELAPPELAGFASVDLAPVPIGENVFWLPTVVRGDSRDHARHFEARYSNYHRYTGSMTILSSTPEPTTQEPKPQ